MVAVEFELLGVVGPTRLKCSEPAAEAGELVRRQPDNSFGDFFDFHAAQYSIAGAWLSVEGHCSAALTQCWALSAFAEFRACLRGVL